MMNWAWQKMLANDNRRFLPDDSWNVTAKSWDACLCDDEKQSLRCKAFQCQEFSFYPPEFSCCFYRLCRRIFAALNSFKSLLMLLGRNRNSTLQCFGKCGKFPWSYCIIFADDECRATTCEKYEWNENNWNFSRRTRNVKEEWKTEILVWNFEICWRFCVNIWDWGEFWEAVDAGRRILCWRSCKELFEIF